jgi:hypothetical protein
MSWGLRFRPGTKPAVSERATWPSGVFVSPLQGSTGGLLGAPGLHPGLVCDAPSALGRSPRHDGRQAASAPGTDGGSSALDVDAGMSERSADPADPKDWMSERSADPADPQDSSFVLRSSFVRSSFFVGRWKLDVRSWMLEVGRWTLDVGSWKLEVGSSKLDVRSWMLDVGCWMLEV